MRALVLAAPRQPLAETERAVPAPEAGELLLRVEACGVCRTDLHLVDGELPACRYPIVPGHQIVGRVEAMGEGVTGFTPGDRVGVPWLGWTCGECRFCKAGLENLCARARFTGCHRDGGFAERALADHRFCFPLPGGLPAGQSAPLLCAGLIGHRAYRMAVAAPAGAATLGLYGFGSAAHILTQVAVAEGREVFAFTRPGDGGGQTFARELGAAWAGGSDEDPPAPLDAALLFAPVGDLVPRALGATRPGGVVVCAGIHMSDIPSFPYALLWGERQLRSVANLTRRDGEEFFALVTRIPVRVRVRTFPLARANEALAALRSGEVEGSVVLEMEAG
jgi:propanol-preferring alcohol dehydrogenase